MAGIQIGQLLVEQGVLTEGRLAKSFTAQKTSSRPFGDLAERIVRHRSGAVEDAWVEQYIRTTGVVDLEDVRVDTDCLRLLNRRQAWQFHALPTNRDDGDLGVATSPENLVRAVNFSSPRSMSRSILDRRAEQLREFLMRTTRAELHRQYAASL